MSASLHESRTAGTPRIEAVADGVFAYIQPDGMWWINNTGFLVGTAGVVSVDTCATERRTRDYLSGIRSVSPLPIVGNLHRAYAELDGHPRGERIDLRAALADMVTYNGGRPLTCLA